MEHQASRRSQQSWNDSDFVEDDSESDFSEEYGGHQRLDRQNKVMMNLATDHHSSSGSLSRNTMSSGSNNNSSSNEKKFRRLDLKTMPKAQSHASRWGAAQQADKAQSRDQSHASRWGSAQQAERNRIQSEDWAQEQRKIEMIEHEKEKQRRLSQIEGFGDAEHNERERRLEEQKKKIELLEKEQSIRLIHQGGDDSPVDLPTKRNTNAGSESRWKKVESKRQNSGKLSVTGLLEDSWANGDDDDDQDEEEAHYRGRPINHDLDTHWHQGAMPTYEGHEQMLKEATDQFREVKQERDEWELQQMEKSKANSTSDDETEVDPASTHTPGKMPNFPKPTLKGISRNRSVDSGHIRDLLLKKDSFMSPIDKLSDSNFEDSLISEATAHDRQKFSKRQQFMNRPHSPSISIQSDESWTDVSPRQKLKPTNAAVASFTVNLPTESDRFENDESIHEKSIGYPASHRSWNQDISEHLSHNDDVTPRTSVVNGYYESWNEKDFEEASGPNLADITSKQISNKSEILNNEVGYEVDENKNNSNTNETNKDVFGYEELGKDGDDISEEKSWVNDQKSSAPSKYSSSERSWVDRSWVDKKSGAASSCSRGMQSLLQDEEFSATNQSWAEPLVRFSEGTQGNRRRSMESARSMNLSHRSWAESFKSWEHDEESQGQTSSVAWSETSHGISQLDNSVMGSEVKENGNSEAKQNTETVSNFHQQNNPEKGAYSKAISPEVLVAGVVSAVYEGEQSQLPRDGSSRIIINPVTGQKTIEMGAHSFTGSSFATSATSKRRHQLEGQATAEAEPSERSYISWRDPGMDASGRSMRNSDAVSARSWNGSNRSWIESQRSWNEGIPKDAERDKHLLRESSLLKLEPKHAEEVPDAECASSASDSDEWKSKVVSEILSADQSNPNKSEECFNGDGESGNLLPSQEFLDFERADSRSDVQDAEKCLDDVASSTKQAKLEAPIDPKEALNAEQEETTPSVRGQGISIPSSNKTEHPFTKEEGLATGGVGEVACENKTEKFISDESPNLQACPSTIEEQIELDYESRKRNEPPKSQDILLHAKDGETNSLEPKNNKPEEIAHPYVVERTDIQHSIEDERETQNLVTQNAALATTAVSMANNIAASESILPLHEANKNNLLEEKEHRQAVFDEDNKISQNFALLSDIQTPIQQATQDSKSTNLDDYHVDSADVTPSAAASIPFEQRDQGTQEKSRDGLIRSSQIDPLDRGKEGLNLEKNLRVKPLESLGSTEQDRTVEVFSESDTQQQGSQNPEAVLLVLQSENASHVVAKSEQKYLEGTNKVFESVASEDRINEKMAVSRYGDEEFTIPQDNSDQKRPSSTYTGKTEDKPEIQGASKLLGSDRIATVHGTSTNSREVNEKNLSESSESQPQDVHVLSKVSSNSVSLNLSNPPNDTFEDEACSRSGSDGPHDVRSRGSLSQNDMSDVRSAVSQSKQSDSHFMSWGQQSASSHQSDLLDRLDRNDVSQGLESTESADKHILNQPHRANPPGKWEDDLISDGENETHSRSGSDGPHDVRSRGSLSQNDMSDVRSAVSQSKQSDSHFMSWGQQSAGSHQSDLLDRLDRNDVSQGLESTESADKHILNQPHRANPPGKWEDDLISDGENETHSRSGSDGPHDVRSRGSLSQNDMSDVRSAVSQSKQSDSHFMSWGQQSASSHQSDLLDRLDRNDVSQGLESTESADKHILNQPHRANPPGKWEDDLISDGENETHSRSGSDGPHDVRSRGSLSQNDMSDVRSAVSQSKQSDSHFMSWGQQSASSHQSDLLDRLDRNDVSQGLESTESADKHILNQPHRANPPGKWEDDLISEGRSSAVSSRLSHPLSDIHSDKTHSRSGSEGPHDVRSRGLLSQNDMSNIRSAASHSSSQHDGSCFKSEAKISDGASDAGSDSRLDGTEVILKGRMPDDSEMRQNSCGPSVNSQDDTMPGLESPNTAKATVTGQDYDVSEAVPRDNLHERRPGGWDQDSASGDGDSDVALPNPLPSPLEKDAHKTVDTSDRSKDSQSLLSLVDAADANSVESYRHEKIHIPGGQQGYDSEAPTQSRSPSIHSQDSTSERLEEAVPPDNLHERHPGGWDQDSASGDGDSDVALPIPLSSPLEKDAHKTVDTSDRSKDSQSVLSLVDAADANSAASYRHEKINIPGGQQGYDSEAPTQSRSPSIHSQDSTPERLEPSNDIELMATLGATTSARTAQGHKDIEAQNPFNRDKFTPPPQDAHADETYFLRGSNEVATKSPNENPKAFGSSTFDQFSDGHGSISDESEQDRAAYFADMDKSASNTYARYAAKYDANKRDTQDPDSMYIPHSSSTDEFDYKDPSMKVIPVDTETSKQDKNAFTLRNAEYTQQGSFGASYPNAATMIEEARMHNDHWQDEDDGLSDDDALQHVSLVDTKLAQNKRKGLFLGIPKNYWLIATVVLIVIIILVLALGLSSKSSTTTVQPSLITSSVPSSSPTVDFSKVSWTKVGDSLPGEELRDQTGFSVSLSGDGTTLAVGARRDSRGGKNIGAVRLYNLESNQGTPFWTLTQDLQGASDGDQFGFSVSLSAKGQRLAIGSIGNDDNGNNSGLVQLFENTFGQWVQTMIFNGSEEGGIFGTSVALSGRGNVLAVGAPYEASNDLIRSGKVYIYSEVEQTGSSTSVWRDMGEPIAGGNVEDWFGWSVSLAEDGMQIVVGAPLEPERAADSGYAGAYIFNEDTDSWDSVGELISGADPRDRFGYSVSLSGDGGRVAVGGYKARKDGMETGKATVYERNNNSWMILGQSLYGDNDGDHFGYDVSLSWDGNIFSVGAPSRGSEEGDGMVRTLKFDDTNESWVQSNDLFGEGNIGFSICLNSNGEMLATGLPSANEARVYNYN